VSLATRAELRPRIEARYSCLRHVVLIHVLALGALAAALAALREPRAIELIALPATFLFANVVEYVFHRGPMHRRRALLGFLFERHTVVHHAYFRSEAMRIEDARDMRFVLFPAFACALVIALAALVALGVSFAISRNVALIFFATATLYYLVYEWFHASFHVFAVERLERIPLLGRAARRHRIHHDPARMTAVNFNITFPIVDRIAGTIADT